jgi:AraC family transcriptional regulator
MDYVRRRRLAFAAAELASGRRILDVALEYGFETHSGFSKAFRRHYGCSPENYRARAPAVRPELPSLDQMKKYVSGGIIMEPKIIARPAFKIAGYSIRTTNAEGQNSTEIPAFWGAYMSDGRCEKMHKEGFLKSHAEYGACFAMNPNGEFTYAIGCEPQDGADIPDGYEVHEITANTYAVFSVPPSDKDGFVAAIQGTWGYIFNEWFPKSGYEYAEGGADFELYEECGKCDIYIPVSKKG